jgi:alkanesulfonate monooxygenase SsuD/methylene tetrahydromethanopterin reductase-like flavin-dependent oxidoreductase (luciferase family)
MNTVVTPPLSCQILPMEPFASAVEHARLADELGYDSVLCSHIAARDSFTVLAALGMLTRRVRLGTVGPPERDRALA